MDLRVKKTRNGIINAFLQLRSKKPLERITVKELADLAEINKATFYLHYKDIYDLSELFQSVFNSIAHPNSVLSDPKLFIRELVEGFVSNQSLIDIIFADERRGILADKFEREVKRFIFEKFPQYKNTPELNIMLTYTIKGGYYAYDENRQFGAEKLVAVIGDMAEGIVAKLRNG